jgi:MYXO-CTERM domain-containing protein
VTSGVGSFYHRSGPVGEEDDNLLWTGDTTFNISPAPVPEPAGAAMALAGIAMLGAARRRNRGILQGR